MKKIKYYFKVYRMLLRLNLLKLFAYRANFYSSAVTHTVWSIFLIVAIALLTSKSSHVFGWTRNELLLMAGCYTVISSFFYFLFSRGFTDFSNIIHFGRLDSILIKPIDSQFLMTCSHASYTQICRFVIGAGFIFFIFPHTEATFSPLLILWFMLLTIFSVTIMYSFWLTLMTIAIWFTHLDNLKELLLQMNQISRFPQEMYKGASIFLFFALFPLTLVVVTPIKVLLQKASVNDIVWLVVCAISLFIISRKFWQFALRSYTSASG
jgi:ABC-2 type transport system permease protein